MSSKTSEPSLGIVQFFRDLFSYIFHRLRVTFVMLGVVAEVVWGWIGDAKDFLVRNMFWGRGRWYRLIVFAAVVVTVFTMPISLYRRAVPSVVIAEESVSATVAQNDLLIEQGSVQTLIPKDRSRIFTTKYVVKGGDTLEQIAYDNDISVTTLQWANDLGSSDLIHPGDVLSIPPGDGVIHTVGDGDTIASLAEKYKASEQGIIDTNWLDYPYELTIGQVVFVPDGVMPEPPKPIIAYTPPATPDPSYGWNDPTPLTGRFLGWPVAGGGGMLAGCYTGWHNGIDIADGSWPNLVASASGVVTMAGCQSGSCPAPGYSYGGYGLAWTVMIDHGNGFSTGYGHMNAISVYSGQWVNAGDIIGQMGASGTAYGVHVHYFLQFTGGSLTNPAPYMYDSVCGY